MQKTYKTLLIDPPWPQGKTGKRSVRPNQETTLDYPTMSLADITALPIYDLLESDGLVFLWTTDRFMEEAHVLLRAWGLKKHCIFVWNKNTGVCPFSVQFRNEYLLMAYKGKFVLKKIGVPTNFSASVTKHSEKPLVSYTLIESLSYEPRLELFARRKIGEWDVWGNEVTSSLSLSPPIREETREPSPVSSPSLLFTASCWEQSR